MIESPSGTVGIDMLCVPKEQELGARIRTSITTKRPLYSVGRNQRNFWQISSFARSSIMEART